MINGLSETQLIYSRLAERVRKLRSKKGMSQEGLAQDSGITMDEIKKIETAQADPFLTTLAALAESLDVHISDLFKRAG